MSKKLKNAPKFRGISQKDKPKDPNFPFVTQKFYGIHNFVSNFCFCKTFDNLKNLKMRQKVLKNENFFKKIKK